MEMQWCEIWTRDCISASLFAWPLPRLLLQPTMESTRFSYLGERIARDGFAKVSALPAVWDERTAALGFTDVRYFVSRGE